MSDNEIVSGIPESLWVAAQVDQDTLNLPTLSGCVPLTSEATFGQEVILVKNKEKRNSYSQKKGKAAGFKIGTFKFSVNFEPSGTVGVEPRIDPLLLSGYGRKTVNAGVDVRYEHYERGATLKYLTMLWKGDVETYLIRGAVVNKLSMKVVATEIQGLDVEGFFVQMYNAGKGTMPASIDGTSTPVDSIVVANSKKFDIGAYITVGTDDNSGSGFEITAIDHATKTITLSPSISTAQSADSIVEGWAPATSQAGVEVVGKFGSFSIDRGSPEDISITECVYELNNGLKGLSDERGNSDFCGKVGRGRRVVSLSVSKYFTKSDLDIKSFVKNAEIMPAVINIGETAGATITVELPEFTPEKSDSSGNEEKKLSFSGQCYDDTATNEDSILIVK